MDGGMVKIIVYLNSHHKSNFNLKLYDDYITYVIISIIIGGRFGYVLFYNLNYYISNPLEIFIFGKEVCLFMVVY